ncbi:MAG TPA: 6-carboxytetrahydropterin synthase [Kofleriaceae bacterium]|nr:6-carboxytetrahydropterin synthase [Kofleriaceae bacterium]
MTVFPDGTKERLHGHNYQVAVALEVERIELAEMIPFAALKAALAELCDAWKEHVLLAAANPRFELVRDADGELEFRLCGDRYVMPRRERFDGDVVDRQQQCVAAHVAELLVGKLQAVLDPRNVVALEATIEESPGQGASCTLRLR